MAWQIERWSGRDADKSRIVFIGSEDKARRRYERIAETLRQGTVRLYGHAGELLKTRSAPRLRTRW